MANHDPPLITVITSTFNCEPTILACLNSVALQSARCFEHIVVDGLSTDGTAEHLYRHANQLAFYVSESDNGVYDAWNKACQKARGDWVLFLGGDDELADMNVLSDFAEILNTVGADVNIVYGDVLLVAGLDSKPVKRMGKAVDKYTNDFIYGKISLPPHQGVFHRRCILKTDKPFDTTYKIAADAKVVYSNFGVESAVYYHRLVSKMRMGGLSTLNKNAILHAKENIRLFKELSVQLRLMNFVTIWGVALLKATISCFPTRIQEALIGALKGH